MWPYKKTVVKTSFVKADESLSRSFIFKPVLAPAGESLSFASPKESNQRKGDPLPLYPARLGFAGRSAERASCPPADARHPCRAPDGLIPAKPAVLGAANGIKLPSDL